MRHFSALLLLSLLFVVSGCGYHLPGRGGALPADVQTASLEMFANGTLEPFLESIVSEAVAERFIRGRLLQVVNRTGHPDAFISGEVVAYSSDPVAYDAKDEISRYRSFMTVSALLRRAGSGEALWKGTISWSEEYPANQNKNLQEDNEASAIQVIGERIADEIYNRLGESF